MVEKELNLKNKTVSQSSVVITMEQVVKEVIKKSPPLDVSRGDLQRGVTYYMTGGDPDKRNPI